jgi:hypothetical protein
MKRSVLVCLVCAAIAGPSVVAAQQEPRPAYEPPQGFVPDSATAVRIAVAVWTPIYGRTEIRSEAPYRATLRDSVWTVVGSFHCERGVTCLGGVAVAEIAKRDGRIIRVSHGRLSRGLRRRANASSSIACPPR